MTPLLVLFDLIVFAVALVAVIAGGVWMVIAAWTLLIVAALSVVGATLRTVNR